MHDPGFVYYFLFPAPPTSPTFPPPLFPSPHLFSSPSLNLQRARATTKKIETPADLEGFPDLKDAEKEEIKQLIQEFVSSKSPGKSPAKSPARGKKAVQSALKFTGPGSATKPPGWYVGTS